MPVREALPVLMRERGLTREALAGLAGVAPSHLSRALRGIDYKTIGPGLASRIALALDLPCDYFPESRAAALASRIEADPQLRDRIHDELFPEAGREADYAAIFGD